MTAIILWFALAPVLQDKGADRVRDLILQLGSESVADRDAALRRLDALGTAAVPELRRAVSHSDREISARATYLLRLFSVRERLTPNLRKAIPGVENRLATGGPGVWTDVFLEASSRSSFPFLESEDLDPLAVPAFHGAKSGGQRATLCIRVALL